ncbi:RCC1 domain-containing protein [Cellulomonas triticagri]|uniref:RCC1 domain-containing protein n=1 Tax=Cellulomonas triticagri TaxID=2483352 RepID=UPI0011C43BFE|nr:RCC1 domain-containing protein [Cellulomonas triticagri]
MPRSVGAASRVRVRGIALLVVGLLVVPNGAVAAPAPDHGPTAGGTTVSGAVPAPPVELTTVAAGRNHAVALGSDGLAYAWGDSTFGQLGNGTTTRSLVPVPVRVPGGVTFTAVSVGLNHSLALGTDGLTYAWGNGSDGRLGNGTTASSSVPVPVSVPDGVTFTSVSAGLAHSVATGSDGLTYAWGDGSDGRLGNGTTASSSVPVPVSVPDGVTFTAVSVGDAHSVATGSDGLTYAWGNGGSGRLGNGTTASSSVPVPVSAPDGVTFTAVFAGSAHSVASGSDGLTYAWGYAASGQLGNFSVTARSVPVLVSVPEGVTFTVASVGADHAVAFGSDGLTYAWGSGVNGQIGNGTASAAFVPRVVSVPDGVAFTAVFAGGDRSVAFGSDGLTYAWGAGTAGQLGNGTTVTSTVPVLVSTEVAVTAVRFGGVPGTGLTQREGAWTVTTPPRCGPVDVEVTYTQVGRTFTRTTPEGFTFGDPPTVVTHPVGADLPAGGGEVELTATADGDPAPDLQWQRAPVGTEDWTDIPAATTSPLRTTITTSTDVRAVFSSCFATVATSTATITVAPVVGPTLSGEPPAGLVGVDYRYAFTVTGDPAPTVRHAGGDLPDGLGLDPATGVLSGTPARRGTYDFTLTATNGSVADGTVSETTASFTIVVAQPRPVHLVLTPRVQVVADLP